MSNSYTIKIIARFEFNNNHALNLKWVFINFNEQRILIATLHNKAIMLYAIIEVIGIDINDIRTREVIIVNRNISYPPPTATGFNYNGIG
ncbi:MAG: hypothetical protein P4L34_04750 [Paludibacter sp.]|nr:hypothetical protein [Paludibacter sp.]